MAICNDDFDGKFQWDIAIVDILRILEHVLRLEIARWIDSDILNFGIYIWESVEKSLNFLGITIPVTIYGIVFDGHGKTLEHIT